jgi:hypothetical protein
MMQNKNAAPLFKGRGRDAAPRAHAVLSFSKSTYLIGQWGQPIEILI